MSEVYDSSRMANYGRDVTQWAAVRIGRRCSICCPCWMHWRIWAIFPRRSWGRFAKESIPDGCDRSRRSAVPHQLPVRVHCT
jgi:hypothetical protein